MKITFAIVANAMMDFMVDLGEFLSCNVREHDLSYKVSVYYTQDQDKDKLLIEAVRFGDREYVLYETYFVKCGHCGELHTYDEHTCKY